MNDIDTGHHLEQFATDMVRDADAGRRHGDLVRIGFGIAEKFGNCLGWNRWMDHQYNTLGKRMVSVRASSTKFSLAPHHTGLMLAARITLAHFSASLAMSLPN